MKIYLAARNSRQSEMQQYRRELMTLGHHVTSRWVTQQCADRDPVLDLQDLRDCDMVIAFTEDPDIEDSGQGGRHVEFGYCFAFNKILIVIGYRENVYYKHSFVKFYPNWPTFIQKLGNNDI